MVENMDLLGWSRKQLEQAEPDLLREMVRSFTDLPFATSVVLMLGGPRGDRSCAATCRSGLAPRALMVSGSPLCRLTATMQPGPGLTCELGGSHHSAEELRT